MIGPPNTVPHPGDALEAELLDEFRSGALVANSDIGWTTIAVGDYGSVKTRDVRDGDAATERGTSTRV